VVSLENNLPLLVFFSSLNSGPARRMDSLVASLARKERSRLRVLYVDIVERPELADHFRVRTVPTLVLVKCGRVVERIVGRVSAAGLERLIESHLIEELSRKGG
jgi:thioredoxin-like negative regulator of GroEL